VTSVTDAGQRTCAALVSAFPNSHTVCLQAFQLSSEAIQKILQGAAAADCQPNKPESGKFTGSLEMRTTDGQSQSC
jgi:HJR/Mrr/RecB family endonuclease